MSLKTCPKCGGPMEKKGGGTDHNLRVEDRSVLKGRHQTRLVRQASRPLMYVCEKCGYLEFYAQAKFSEAMKKEKKRDQKKKPTEENYQYFT